MNAFLVHGIEWIITACLAGIVGYLASTLKRRKTHEHAMEIGMQVLLRKALIDSYDYYHHQDHKLTIERKREIDEAYEAYITLGGNGTIRHMYEDTTEKDVWIERG